MGKKYATSDNAICLASPFHDPDARLLEFIQENGEKLLQRYNGNAVISVSPTTSPKIISLLRSQQFTVQIQRKDSVKLIGNNYLSSIKLALPTKTRYIHLVDFDRALHWIKRFPRELRDIIEIFPSCQGFISFVRTKRAFETHPFIQRATEQVVNSIAAEVAGVDVDIMSGSYGFENLLAKKILTDVKQKDYGIYAEFLRIAIKHHSLISTIEVEGLEWETPDQFQREIRQKGYMEWLQEFESLAQWGRRVELVKESTDVFLNK